MSSFRLNISFSQEMIVFFSCLSFESCSSKCFQSSSSFSSYFDFMSKILELSSSHSSFSIDSSFEYALLNSILMLTISSCFSVRIHSFSSISHHLNTLPCVLFNRDCLSTDFGLDLMKAIFSFPPHFLFEPDLIFTLEAEFALSWLICFNAFQSWVLWLFTSS